MKPRMWYPSQTFAQTNRLAKSWTEWLTKLDFELFVTLNFNTASTFRRLRSAFKALLARLDRRFLGRKWYKVSSHLRTRAVAVVENLNTNPHLHVVLTLPQQGQRLTITRQEMIIRKYWNSLVRSGSADVKEIYDLKGLAHYLAKQLSRPGHFEKFMFAEEFHTE